MMISGPLDILANLGEWPFKNTFRVIIIILVYKHYARMLEIRIETFLRDFSFVITRKSLRNFLVSERIEN